MKYLTQKMILIGLILSSAASSWACDNRNASDSISLEEKKIIYDLIYTRKNVSSNCEVKLAAHKVKGSDYDYNYWYSFAEILLYVDKNLVWTSESAAIHESQADSYSDEEIKNAFVQKLLNSKNKYVPNHKMIQQARDFGCIK